MTSIQFSHANGIPAAVYAGFLSEFSAHQVHAIPVSGEGKHKIRHSWRPLAQELIETIEARQQGPVIGIGHSLGAVSTFWAAIERPDLFEQVYLLEPPLFDFRIRFLSSLTRLIGIQDRVVPIIKQAGRRRDHFDSREAAAEYWQGKRFFKYFHPQAFADYVAHGLVEDPAGGVRLRISKAQEARIFASSPFRIGPAQLSMPSYYLHASKGVLPLKTIQAHQTRFSNTTFVPVEGGHMFPLEQPVEIAQLISQLIASHG
jgi:pimeloyl-ACP methyl ester carboxylesterase